MEIIKLENSIQYEQIIDLVKNEWPKQWEEVTEKEMLLEMYKSDDSINDINKIIFDNTKTIGWCRYTLWLKNNSQRKFNCMEAQSRGK